MSQKMPSHPTLIIVSYRQQTEKANPNIIEANLKNDNEKPLNYFNQVQLWGSNYIPIFLKD